MIRTVLIGLELLTGVAALGGGTYAFCGAPGVSREWLKGSPFRSYLIPGLVLFFVVGGSMLAAAALLFAGVSAARTVSLEAGVVLVGWIAAQVSVMGYRSWLQPVFGIVGLAVIGLSFLLPSPG